MYTTSFGRINQVSSHQNIVNCVLKRLKHKLSSKKKNRFNTVNQLQ